MHFWLFSLIFCGSYKKFIMGIIFIWLLTRNQWKNLLKTRSCYMVPVMSTDSIYFGSKMRNFYKKIMRTFYPSHISQVLLGLENWDFNRGWLELFRPHCDDLELALIVAWSLLEDFSDFFVKFYGSPTGCCNIKKWFLRQKNVLLRSITSINSWCW